MSGGETVVDQRHIPEVSATEELVGHVVAGG